jgi:DNA polymerase III sliding clamp (beta) subunit (PCNA family)
LESNCECTELKIRNIILENFLETEQILRQKFEASSHIYSFELQQALDRLSMVENKLRMLRTSFQFLNAGISGFSSDLNMAIDSIVSSNIN